MHLLLAFRYRWIACHIPPLVHFSTVNNISISVKRSKFILVFFKAACHTNHVQLFQDKYFESSQIHLLTVTYNFQHTNHGINHGNLFCFTTFTNSFCVHVICISDIFQLGDCKNLLFQVMMLNWISPNHPYRVKKSRQKTKRLLHFFL